MKRLLQLSFLCILSNYTYGKSLSITDAPLINISNEKAYTVAGRCKDEDQPIKLFIRGHYLDETVCTHKKWSLTTDVSFVSDQLSLKIRAVMKSLNGKNVSAKTKTSKKTSLPMVSFDPAPLINGANNLAYTLSGTCSENGRFLTLSIGNINVSPKCVAHIWRMTFDVSALEDDLEIPIAILVSDAFGNTNRAETKTTKDTVSPY